MMFACSDLVGFDKCTWQKALDIIALFGVNVKTVFSGKLENVMGDNEEQKYAARIQYDGKTIFVCAISVFNELV